MTYTWKRDRLLRVDIERFGEKLAFELGYDCRKGPRPPVLGTHRLRFGFAHLDAVLREHAEPPCDVWL